MFRFCVNSMNNEIIKIQVDNIINSINNIMNDKFDVSCIMNFFCIPSKENVNLIINTKRDGKLSNAEFEISIPKEYDYLFYDQLFIALAENYITHDTISISDITKKFKLMTGILNQDFDYNLNFAKIDSNSKINLYITPYSKTHEFEKSVINYNNEIKEAYDRQNMKKQ